MYPQDESSRRLLLSEVLLEEYESLDQPRLDQNEIKKVKEHILTVIKLEQFEGDAWELSGIYYEAARAYEALFYRRMSADNQRTFANKPDTPEITRALDKLNQVVDWIIDAYAHAVALAGDDPQHAKDKTVWRNTLTGFYRFRHDDSDVRLEETIDEVLKKPLPSKDHLSRTAETLHGEIVSIIYKLMRTAQGQEARQKRQQKYLEWQGDFKGKLIERAAVGDILGTIADLRCKYEEEHADVPDRRERQRTVHSDILEAVRRGEPGESEDEPDAGGKGTGSGKGKPDKDISLADAEKKFGRTLRSALCLSGGGIRSAIFNLGILEGLARHGLLEKFDYLSTVSGGGFTGGWLSAWMYRDGLDSVIKQLEEPPKSPLKPEPAPIEHLRVYSNYLSPQPGLLSADTWTLVAMLLRNLTLNWLVFIPVLMVFLLAPRIWAAILFRSVEYKQYAQWAYLVAGVLAGWVSFTYIGLNLPSSNDYESNPPAERYKGGQGPFVFWCLLWMTVSAAAFAVFFWLRDQLAMTTLKSYDYIGLTVAIIIVPWMISIVKICRTRAQPHEGLVAKLIVAALVCIVVSGAIFAVLWLELRPHEMPLAWYDYLALTATIVVVPWIIVITKICKIPGWTYKFTLILATALILVAQFVTGYLLRYTTKSILPYSHLLLYATVAVPLILLFMSVGGTLIAGFTSRFTNDDDQEWWARAGAWLFIVVVSWSILHVLVLFGPLMILALDTTYHRIVIMGITKIPWSDIAKLAGTLVGIVSGIITLVGGFSAKTPANAKEAEASSFASIAVSVLTILVAPIFLGFVFILIALGTNWLLVSSFGQRISWCIAEVGLPYPSEPLLAWHTSLLRATPFRYLFVVAGLLTLLAVIMGRLISTNNFSLQYMWRNRIIRACLGASRRIGTRRPNPFTGFDTYDNLLMHELRPQPANVEQPDPYKDRPDDDLPNWRPKKDRPVLRDKAQRKLLHVLNLALNLTGGKKLQWQDRKAESFTVSPLHAGSYWLGYRRSYRYGGLQGISLGTAIAISGAFASPNMGYMMTSPVVRFIMALFNVRLGAWLGNPGPRGEKPSLIERIANVPLTVFGVDRDARPFRLRSPGLSVLPIVSEAFGSVDDESPYVYLSDGGHFENLGLYEMVLRRCRFIVVSDASSDPDYSFQSLAMAVRQIRIDLGVPIDIPEFSVTFPSQDLKSKYCAIGKIRYSCVDRDPDDPETCDEDFNGVLIYLKPSLIGEEPRDVINYWQGSKDFPQETITDQWFSEAQFESYRALGSHIIDALCDPEDMRSRNKVSFAALERKVREHNQLDFRAFGDNVGYALLEHQSIETKQLYPYARYRQRVERFVDRLLGRR